VRQSAILNTRLFKHSCPVNLVLSAPLGKLKHSVRSVRSLVAENASQGSETTALTARTQADLARVRQVEPDLLRVDVNRREARGEPSRSGRVAITRLNASDEVVALGEDVRSLSKTTGSLQPRGSLIRVGRHDPILPLV